VACPGEVLTDYFVKMKLCQITLRKSDYFVNVSM